MIIVYTSTPSIILFFAFNFKFSNRFLFFLAVSEELL